MGVFVPLRTNWHQWVNLPCKSKRSSEPRLVFAFAFSSSVSKKVHFSDKISKLLVISPSCSSKEDFKSKNSFYWVKIWPSIWPLAVATSWSSDSKHFNFSVFTRLSDVNASFSFSNSEMVSRFSEFSLSERLLASVNSRVKFLIFVSFEAASARRWATSWSRSARRELYRVENIKNIMLWEYSIIINLILW